MQNDLVNMLTSNTIEVGDGSSTVVAVNEDENYPLQI